MRPQRDPAGQRACSDAVGLLKAAWLHLSHLADAAHLMAHPEDAGRAVLPEAALPRELRRAHGALSEWMRGGDEEREVEGAYLCYADGELVVQPGGLDAHLASCPGGEAGEHWPVVAYRGPSPVTRRSRRRELEAGGRQAG
jgi:hypothetical protein